MSTHPLNVPFMDIQSQNRRIALALQHAVQEVIDSNSFCLGPAVEAFEENFAAYCGTAYAIGCNSGTSAIHLALKAIDLRPGDEVITVAHTFIATVWPILYCGATPVFADVDPKTRTLDPNRVEHLITSRTKAILPVHLYGQPADMDPLLRIANSHGLYLIEDAAQAHGAQYKGHKVGSLGHLGCFSFYPGKNLGAFGEGGAIVTHDSNLDERLRMLRDHGQRQRYYHEMLAFNYRMEGIQGAVLNVKLRYLDQWIAAREEVAQTYDRALTPDPTCTLPHRTSETRHAFHLYVIQHPDRDMLHHRLAEKGVQTRLHYPVPVHQQPAVQPYLSQEVDLPVTENLAASCLSLPIYPELTEKTDTIEKIAAIIQAPN